MERHSRPDIYIYAGIPNVLLILAQSTLCKEADDYTQQTLTTGTTTAAGDAGIAQRTLNFDSMMHK